MLRAPLARGFVRCPNQAVLLGGAAPALTDTGGQRAGFGEEAVEAGIDAIRDGASHVARELVGRVINVLWG